MRSWLFGRRIHLVKRRSLMELLEERIVLDAAVNSVQVDDAAANAQNSAGADAAVPQQTSGAAGGNTSSSADNSADVLHQDLSVVLISNALDQIDAITSAVQDGATAIVYDSTSSNLADVIEQLQQEVESTGQKIGVLEWFTHGDPGVLKVGDNLVFSSGTIESNAEAWQALGSLMAAGARIDLYGCDIGQGADGLSLVQTISAATGAVVWASDDTTGSGEGADWDLEVKSGESNLPSAIDTSVLESHDIVLDNSDLTNAGFETGTITGWTVSHTYAVVSASTGGNHGGIDVGASPYAGSSQYMLRLDSQDTSNSDLATYSSIQQTFTYTSGDNIVFAYAVATSDGSQYGYYDEFGYEVVVNGVTQVSYLINSGDVPPDVWQTLRVSGWREVNIDLSSYAEMGDTVQLRIWAGNTVDNIWDTWAFIDMPTSSYHLPTADPTTVTVARDESITFYVVGHDPDLHSVSQVSFDILENYGPTHGTIVAEDESGNPTSPQYDSTTDQYYQVFTYTPDPGYWGEDSFLFTFSTPSGSWRGFMTDTGWPIGDRSETYSAYDLALVDLNLDGLPDLVTANYNGTTNPDQANMVYMGDPNSFFTDGVSMDLYWTAQDSTALAVGDLNNDGYPDVVVHNVSPDVSVVYLWDNSAGAFTTVNQLSGSAGATTGGVALGDFDRDGDLDVVMGNDNGRDRIYWNNGDGSFSATSTLLPTTSGTTSVVETGDFNGDGYVDIFIGKSSRNSQQVILYNDGYGGFSSTYSSTINVTRDVSDVAVGDVDGDGDLDIVLARSNSRTNYFLENTGLDSHGYATWNVTQITADSQDTRGIALADVDCDGDLDVIAANYGDNVRLYLFNGTSFTTGTDISSSNLNGLSVAAADCNGDGDTDVVVGIDGDNNLLFQNWGFNGGSTTDRHTDAAEVAIHVEPIYNWSFENTDDHYDGWTLSETYSTPTPPEYILPEFGTFAIIQNQDGGTTINWGDVLYDYYDQNDQIQLSVQTLEWVPGMPGITIDGSQTAYTAAILSGGLRDAVLTQIVTIPQDVYLESLEFHWDVSYWNSNPVQADGSEFNSNQFVAVYLYDASTGTPVAVWTTTNGQDDAVVGSMVHHEITLEASSALVQAINSHDVQLVIQFEVCGLEYYLDAAIDDFTLVPTRHYPAFQSNPVAMASSQVLASASTTTVVTDSGSASSGAVSMTLASVASPLTSRVPVTYAEPVAYSVQSPLLYDDLGSAGTGVWDESVVGSITDSSSLSSLSVLLDQQSTGVDSFVSYDSASSDFSEGTTLNVFSQEEEIDGILIALDEPAPYYAAGGTDAEGQGGSGTPTISSDGGESLLNASNDQSLEPEAVIEPDSSATLTDGLAQDGAGTASEFAGDGAIFDPIHGVVFDLRELDMWQAMVANQPAPADAHSFDVARNLPAGSSFAVAIDSLSFLDLFS